MVRSALWARQHPEEAGRLVAAESGFDSRDIPSCYEPDFTAKLMLETSPQMIAMLEVMKSFLHERGYIPRNFDTMEWLDPRPLAEARAREGVDSAAARKAEPALA